MLLGLLLAVQVAVVDTLPRVTLAEALERATRLDPNYVASLGQIDNAAWSRRAAYLAFILPSITAQGSYQISSTPSFNVGTGAASETFVVAQLVGQYELFAGGRKFADLAGAKAQLAGAEAGELESRFASALLTESAYYDLVSNKELTEVARQRVARAEEQLVVARARVLSGAEVQTDSLRLLLELTRARVDLLRTESLLRVSRLTLGRLVGIDGPVDAAPLDTDPAPDLPLSLEEAIAEALAQGPTYRVVRANERLAGAQLWAQRSAWLPQIGLTASTVAFDEKIFPSATKRSTFSIGVSLPIWNGGRREIAITQARVNRDVARAIREDFERAARPDVTQAYDQYLTSRATTELAVQAVVVAEENYRVQEARYRSGATDILDLLEAQVNLSDAQAGVVQTRTATRLALAGLEAILGRRLFTGKE